MDSVGLLEASKRGLAGNVQQLLANGADPNARDAATGCTAVHAASAVGSGEVVAALVAAGADVKCTDNDGCTPLHTAAFHGHTKLVRALARAGADVDTVDKRGRTALHLAAQQGDARVVQALLKLGAKVGVADAERRHPLHWAAETKSGATVKVLLARDDIEVDPFDEVRRTPLHLASRHGRRLAVKLLLDRGAASLATDLMGDTPLHLLAEHSPRSTSVAKLLLSAGADPRVRNTAGRSATRVCRAHGEAGKELLKLLEEARQRGGGSASSPARPPRSVATPTRQAGNSSTAATNGDGPTHAVHADAGASSQAVNVPCLTADQPSLTADQPSGAGARQPTPSSGSPAVDGDAGAFAAPVGGAAAGDQPHNNASATEVEQAATTATNEAAGASDPGVDVGSDIAGRSTLPGPQALAAKQSNGQTPSPRMAQLRPHPLSIPAPRADATQTHRRGDTDVSPIPQSHQPGRGRLGWSLVAVGVVVVAAAAVVVMRRRR